jgi:excisionase family DNA binding protein
MDSIRNEPEVERQRRGLQRAMSIDEFCSRYGPGRTKVYQELKSGRLRARKIGTRTVITEEDAETWLQHLPVIESV